MTRKQGESELSSAGSAAVPIDRAAIGTRISEIAKAAGGKQALSDSSGVSIAQIHRYTTDEPESLPGAEALIGMWRGSGVSIHWVCTGEGPRLARDAAAPSAAPAAEESRVPYTNDVLLIQRAVIAVEAYLAKHSLAPPPERKALLIALVFDTAKASGVDPEKTLEPLLASLRAA